MPPLRFGETGNVFLPWSKSLVVVLFRSFSGSIVDKMVQTHALSHALLYKKRRKDIRLTLKFGCEMELNVFEILLRHAENV